MNKTIARVSFVGIVTGVAFVGMVGGTALAQAPGLLSPAGLTPGAGSDAAPASAPTYPENDSGQTFGSVADAISPATEPDLILVVADNGQEGYVLKRDLDEANGMSAAASFRSVGDALTWQTANAGTIHRLGVYEADGITKVGVFTVVNETR